jgi:hypothetical protein
MSNANTSVHLLDHSPPKNACSYIFNTGTTRHYLLLDTQCLDKQPTDQPLQVTLPNGKVIQSSHMAKLPFPNLPQQAIDTHIFPNLHNHALLSIRVFCDAGCTVEFTRNKVMVQHQERLVLEGVCEPPGLWKTIPDQDQQANPLFTAPFKRKATIFLHASMFSPTTQTWTKAIDNGHFKNWPIFTAKEVRTNLPKSIATAMGHLDQQQKNLRSTKVHKRSKQVEATEEINDTNLQQETATHKCFANVIKLYSLTEKILFGSNWEISHAFSRRQFIFVSLIYIQYQCHPNRTAKKSQ